MTDFIAVDGATIASEIIGASAEAIVLINGHMRSKSDFKLLARRLSDDGLRAVLFDNRGCGQTTQTRDFSLADMVNDVRAVMGHYQLPKATILGISMGGMVAQQFALAHAAQTQRLILVSTTPDYQILRSDAKPWGRDVEAITARLRQYVSPHFFVSNTLLIKAMAKQIAQAVVANQFDEHATAQRAALVQAPNSAQTLASLKCNTLIIHGELDQIIPPIAAQMMHQQIAGSELLLFPEHGHLLLAEASANLTRAIVNFCKS